MISDANARQISTVLTQMHNKNEHFLKIKETIQKFSFLSRYSEYFICKRLAFHECCCIFAEHVGWMLKFHKDSVRIPK